MFCCAITFFSVMCLSTCSTGLCTSYRWFLWGVASLPEGKSLDLCLVQLCAKHSLIPRPFPPPVFDRILYKNGGGNGLGMRLCKTQASKRYIKSLPLVPKDKRSCFSQGEKSASLKVKGLLYSCLLITHLPSRSGTLNWHLETIYRGKVGIDLPITIAPIQILPSNPLNNNAPINVMPHYSPIGQLMGII